MSKTIVAAVIGVILVCGVAACGTDTAPPDGVAPTPTQVAVATAAPVPPPASPVPVGTPATSPSPGAEATSSPTPVPTATPSPIPATTRLPKLTARVPGATRVRYFGVRGESPDELLADVVRRSRSSCQTADTLACVIQRPRVTWTNRTQLSTGACTIVTPRVSLTSTVHLPRWQRPKRVDPALLDWWQQMLDHMAWHEGRHIEIQKSHDRKLVRSMAGRNCSAANKVYRKWLRTVDAAQDRFDAKDALWPYPEYAGPTGS